MATLTLQNIPDDLHAALNQLAKMHQRSVDEEAVAVFEHALPNELSRAERIANTNANTESLRQTMTGFLSAKEIDEAVEEGRM